MTTTKSNKKVLVIATSRNTRGGVTAVVKAHEQGEQWNKFHCKWIATHIDKGLPYKLWYFFKSFIVFLFNLPFYDIVHVHFSEPPSAIRKTPFVFLTKLFRKKLILHFHSFSPESTITSRFHGLYKYLFKKADCVLVLSEYWKTALIEAIPNLGTVEVILNPCENVITTRANKTLTILYAGTLNQRKGYSDLINAFAPLAVKYSEWKVVFAGNGELDKAKELTKQHGISKQIEFKGWISGDVKEKLFSEASIFCLPSYAEGLPMALLDAWAYGLPSIITPVGGIPDVAVHKENALLFAPGNVAELTSQLESLMSSETLRSDLSKQSQVLVDTKLSQKLIAERLSSIYDNISSS